MMTFAAVPHGGVVGMCVGAMVTIGGPGIIIVDIVSIVLDTRLDISVLPRYARELSIMICQVYRL